MTDFEKKTLEYLYFFILNEITKKIGDQLTFCFLTSEPGKNRVQIGEMYLCIIFKTEQIFKLIIITI